MGNLRYIQNNSSGYVIKANSFTHFLYVTGLRRAGEKGTIRAVVKGEMVVRVRKK
jgi:hypothetical protein